MKKLRLLAILLALIALACSFSGCSDKRKDNVRLYNVPKTDVRETFIAEDELAASKGSSNKRTYFIHDKQTYDSIFTDETYLVDFSKETLIVYAFLDIYRSRNYTVDEVEIVGKKLTVYYKHDMSLWDQIYSILVPRNSACSPYIRYFALKVEGTEITEVTFKEVSPYFWKK